MRLTHFIDENMEAILSEWDSFAATLVPAAGGLDVATLRDHAKEILRTVARDLATAQSATVQAAKSRGEAVASAHLPDTPAETHGLLRATSGFTLKQLVAEYRALRASVLKLWAREHMAGPFALEDMTRFNEAIDQAVAESVDFFAAETERWRNVFLGVLGHDLRGPLNAVLLTSHVLSRLNSDMAASKLTARLINGGERMKQLLDDLLDYSRASLELGIPVNPAPIELATLCEEEIELQRAAWPDHAMELVASGDTGGVWDGARMKQVLGNLISNAAKYGNPRTPIIVRLTGGELDVAMSVENAGSPISPGAVEALFEPLQRAATGDAEAERTSLGLGLFIVRHIVQAHRGTVTLESMDGMTVFSIRLPR